MSRSNVILYSTTFAATLKTRSDITKIKHILDSKKLPYDDVDLSNEPHRRVDMLKYSDNNHTLPQLHVNNRFIGSADDIQELEDWGELEAILRGASPGKLAAESAAAAHAEALAYSASLASGTAAAAAPARALAQPEISPPRSPPAPGVVDEETEVEAFEDKEKEESCTSREIEEESLRENLEPELEDQQKGVLDELEPLALDIEESDYKDLEATTEVEIVEKLEQQEELEEEEEHPTSLLPLPTVPTEETCYSPLLLQTNSQKEEGNIDSDDTPAIEPELVVVQATFQDLDLTASPTYRQLDHNNEDSVPSNLSSVPPSPSPLPFTEEREEQVSDEEHVLEFTLNHDQQQQQESPSSERFLEAHPLGDAVHAHAVPLADHTTEDEEYILVENFTSATSSPIVLPFEEKEEHEDK